MEALIEGCVKYAALDAARWAAGEMNFGSRSGDPDAYADFGCRLKGIALLAQKTAQDVRTDRSFEEMRADKAMRGAVEAAAGR